MPKPSSLFRVYLIRVKSASCLLFMKNVMIGRLRAPLKTLSEYRCILYHEFKRETARF